MCWASPVDADPTPVDGVPGLWAAQVDTRGRFEQSWSHIRGYLVGVLAARGMAEVQAEELTVLPGAEEIVALLELRRLAESGDFDVDRRRLRADRRDAAAAGAARDHRLLRPAAARRAAAGAAQHRGVASPALPGSVPNATVRDAFGDLLTELMAARALLADPEVTGVRLVLTPERVVIAEARRLFTALSLHGFTVEAVTVNRVLPAEVGGEFLRRQREAQREAMVQVSGIVRGPDDPARPDDSRRTHWCAALSELAKVVFGAVDPLGPPVTRSGSTSSGADGWYRLALPLPLVRAGRHLTLSRSGADLVVTVGDVRRRIALPSVLQRCTVSGARLRTRPADDRLRRRPGPVAGRACATAVLAEVTDRWWAPGDRHPAQGRGWRRPPVGRSARP